jgi:hypothetical protein
VKINNLIFATVPNDNKERSKMLLNCIFYQNSDSVINFFLGSGGHERIEKQAPGGKCQTAAPKLQLKMSSSSSGSPSGSCGCASSASALDPSCETSMKGLSVTTPANIRIKIDMHTHILPKTWPDLKEKYGYGGFVSLEHHHPHKAKVIDYMILCVLYFWQISKIDHLHFR